MCKFLVDLNVSATKEVCIILAEKLFATPQVLSTADRQQAPASIRFLPAIAGRLRFRVYQRFNAGCLLQSLTINGDSEIQQVPTVLYSLTVTKTESRNDHNFS